MNRHPATSRPRASARPVLLFGLATLTIVSVLIGSCVALRALASNTPGAEGGPDQPRDPLMLYCAAGLREPVARALRDYEQETGVAVDLHAHGSGTLFGQLRTEAEQGGGPDLYLSAEDTWIKQGRDAGLLDTVVPLGEQRPVLVVRQGNPKQVASARDLIDSQKRIAFGIGNQGAAIGGATRSIATALGILDPMLSLRKTEMETVVALTSAVALGTLDAAVVWDIAAKQTAGVEIVALPASERRVFGRHTSAVSIAVTTTTGHPDGALALARYLATRGLGLHDSQTQHGPSAPAHAAQPRNPLP